MKTEIKNDIKELVFEFFVTFIVFIVVLFVLPVVCIYLF